MVLKSNAPFATRRPSRRSLRWPAPSNCGLGGRLLQRSNKRAKRGTFGQQRVTSANRRRSLDHRCGLRAGIPARKRRNFDPDVHLICGECDERMVAEGDDDEEGEGDDVSYGFDDQTEAWIAER